MEILIEIYHRLLRERKRPYLRAFYKDFSLDQRLTGIVGARGIGKTSFLLHYLEENYAGSDRALYVSADHIYFSSNSLVSLVDQFYKEYDGELICIDEIHKYKNWNQELKNIYDSYPKLQIMFSGSSSIDLIKGKYDLSRRANLRQMSGFSFREYLEIKTETSFPVLSLEDIVSRNYPQEILSTSKLTKHFKDYVQQGYYPIFIELPKYQNYMDSLVNIIEKVIYEDISGFYNLKTTNLDSFKKILYFIANSSPGGFSINQLANSLGKDHTVTADYLEMLRESGLLRYLLNNKQGHSLIRNAEKIYFNNSNLTYAINNSIGKETNIGTIRELFVLSHLGNAGYKVFYAEAGDIQCEDYIFEIGGKSKKSKQIKDLENAYLVKDNCLIASSNSIPLYLFGFLS
ncbi:MAG: ATP-binding protein [Candidatus Melainabacteria bacterium]|jgi:uncharacterized protein|nr:ATP-binding protein [Candidatus Melainabacteria bacterium]